jgi:F-box/leucine-rich repeat protein 14
LNSITAYQSCTTSLGNCEKINILSLNDDVLKVILSLCRTSFGIKLRSVCSRFKSILDQEVSGIYFLKIPNSLDMNFLNKFSSLKKLDFSCLRITDSHVGFISKELKIEFLNFSSCSLITKKTIDKLSSISGTLIALNLSDTKLIGHRHFTTLCNLTNLTNLDLFNTNITGDDFLSISTLPKLKNLDIGSCHYVKSPSDALANISKITTLTSLSLRESVYIDDRDLMFIKEAKNLTALDLSDCVRIQDESLMPLSDLKMLKYLFFEGCLRIHLLSFLSLNQSIYLQTLDMKCCPHICDDSLEIISKMTSLTCLSVSNCMPITSEGLNHLKELTELRNLDLSGCFHITNKGIKIIKTLTKLEYLNIDRCDLITDLAIAYLSALKNLKCLKIASIFGISRIGIELLKCSNKRINIYF